VLAADKLPLHEQLPVQVFKLIDVEVLKRAGGGGLFQSASYGLGDLSLLA